MLLNASSLTLCIEKIHVDRRGGENCSPTSKKETLVIAITQIMRGYVGKRLKSGPDQDKIGDSIMRERECFFLSAAAERKLK